MTSSQFTYSPFKSGYVTVVLGGKYLQLFLI